MTDGSGTVVWAADYKPFGEASITVSTITNNLRFPGQYFDAETGLHYNYYRDYNPVIGRYVEKDPIGIRGGINLYRYVKNNPLKYKDPRGLVWVYDQSTGTMVHVDDQTGVATYTGEGYSGNGTGLNNPAEQGTTNVGPIPQGTYDIGQQRDSPNTGPGVLDLTPIDGTNTNGRDGFQVHGDNNRGDNSASRGCIVQNRNTRDQMQNSNDRTLEVIP